MIGQRLKKKPAILMDVKGPEIRTGYLQNPINLIRGDLIDLVFTAQPEPPRIEDIWQIEVNYDKLHEHISTGKNVLLDNGLILIGCGNIAPTNTLSSSPRCPAKK